MSWCGINMHKLYHCMASLQLSRSMGKQSIKFDSASSSTAAFLRVCLRASLVDRNLAKEDQELGVG